MRSNRDRGRYNRGGSGWSEEGKVGVVRVWGWRRPKDGRGGGRSHIIVGRLFTLV